MRFTNPRRRQPPPVIIISLIDVLIVMLIFMMVTTTFRQHPALKIALPESRQAQEGVSQDTLVVTIAKEEPYFHLGPRTVTLDKLEEEIVAQARANPKLIVSIRPDKDAPTGKFINVLDIAREAGVKTELPIYAEKPRSQ